MVTCARRPSAESHFGDIDTEAPSTFIPPISTQDFIGTLFDSYTLVHSHGTSSASLSYSTPSPARPTMTDSPPYDDILGDESFAPLKRNHACLQCKKRKVKCDAVSSRRVQAFWRTLIRSSSRLVPRVSDRTHTLSEPPTGT